MIEVRSRLLSFFNPLPEEQKAVESFEGIINQNPSKEILGIENVSVVRKQVEKIEGDYSQGNIYAVGILKASACAAAYLLVSNLYEGTGFSIEKLAEKAQGFINSGPFYFYFALTSTVFGTLYLSEKDEKVLEVMSQCLNRETRTAHINKMLRLLYKLEEKIVNNQIENADDVFNFCYKVYLRLEQPIASLIVTDNSPYEKLHFSSSSPFFKESETFKAFVSNLELAARGGYSIEKLKRALLRILKLEQGEYSRYETLMIRRDLQNTLRRLSIVAQS